jgi:hypothetical protein
METSTIALARLMLASHIKPPPENQLIPRIN